MSRRSDLMDKPLTYRTLSDLIFDFEDSYKKYLHSVKKVKIGLYVPHEPHSFQPIEWKQLVLNVSKMMRTEVRKELEKFARDMRMKVGPRLQAAVSQRWLCSPTEVGRAPQGGSKGRRGANPWQDGASPPAGWTEEPGGKGGEMGLWGLAALWDEGCPWACLWRGEGAGHSHGERGFGAFPAFCWQQEPSRCAAKYGAGSRQEVCGTASELFWVPGPCPAGSWLASVCPFGSSPCVPLPPLLPRRVAQQGERRVVTPSLHLLYVSDPKSSRRWLSQADFSASGRGPSCDVFIFFYFLTFKWGLSCWHQPILARGPGTATTW